MNHYAVHQKLTEHCNSTILQLKKKKLKNLKKEKRCSGSPFLAPFKLRLELSTVKSLKGLAGPTVSPWVCPEDAFKNFFLSGNSKCEILKLLSGPWKKSVGSSRPPRPEHAELMKVGIVMTQSAGGCPPAVSGGPDYVLTRFGVKPQLDAQRAKTWAEENLQQRRACWEHGASDRGWGVHGRQVGGWWKSRGNEGNC